MLIKRNRKRITPAIRAIFVSVNSVDSVNSIILQYTLQYTMCNGCATCQDCGSVKKLARKNIKEMGKPYRTTPSNKDSANRNVGTLPKPLPAGARPFRR